MKEKFGESLELLKTERISDWERERQATITSNYLLLGQRITKEELGEVLETTLGEVGEKVMQSAIGEWIKEGRQQGLQQGRQEGRQEGLREGKAEMLLQVLQKRFNHLGQQTQRQIKRLSIAELDELLLASFDLQSVRDLTKWLRQHTGK